MNRLCRHHRWAPLVVRRHPRHPVPGVSVCRRTRRRRSEERGEGIRLLLPPFAFFTYWVLAVVFNLRTAVVKLPPAFVCALSFPIGTNKGSAAPTLPSATGGTLLSTRTAMKSKTFHRGRAIQNTGRQVDVFIPLETAYDAIQAAHEIGRVLNANPAEPHRSSHGIQDSYRLDLHARRLSLMALMVPAIVLGLVWESCPELTGSERRLDLRWPPTLTCAIHFRQPQAIALKSARRLASDRSPGQKGVSSHSRSPPQPQPRPSPLCANSSRTPNRGRNDLVPSGSLNSDAKSPRRTPTVTRRKRVFQDQMCLCADGPDRSNTSEYSNR